ncbi:hypothetical protein PIB30_114446, partial [Stylosanthes scabra]|nr:hypothetical protein [Stylosanthes scabra]
TRPPFQPQQRPPYQQLPPFSQQNNLNQPPKPQPTSFEAALEKLTLTTTTFVQTTNNFMEETRANFRNQEAAIRNLETQVGQIAKQLAAKEECKAITLRSGRTLEEDKVRELNKQMAEEESKGKSTKGAQKSEEKPADKSIMQ